MKKVYVLPEYLRAELKKPFGELITNDEEICRKYHSIDGVLVTVGDVCTRRALGCGKKPLIAIIDFKTKRELIYKHEEILKEIPSDYRRLKVKNNPGTISEDLINVISDAFNRKEFTLIVVEGEEDLSVIPAIIHAPPGAYIVYGQPDEGAVFIKVSDELKEKAQEILNSMVVTWDGASN